ncbi:ABC transporter permease [Bifidobacterium psychraerophilum]|uniref:ABC transporter permease n=1 Tax=Bifidobacterium psychraerophilum TaxID=218140 RepID=UPI0039ED5F8E
MKTFDVISSAIANAFRSKTRTLLTILAIFIGAFTLTITTGLGTGINNYITQTVSEIGSDNVMTVTHTVTQDSTPGSTPQKYDSDAVTTQTGPVSTSADPITQSDLDAIDEIDGVQSVKAVKQISVNYIQHGNGTPYTISVGSVLPGVNISLADGEQPDANSSERQVVIPANFVSVLGFSSNTDAIGKEITFGLSDATGTAQTVNATIVGISEDTGITGQSAASPNDALTDALYSAQSKGRASDSTANYASATITFNPNASDTATQDLKDRLSDAGYTATTLDDTLGSFTSVIDAIVLVLNAFAVIALLAAGFGIINTLYMSVQERTREIGLMKAMGMGSGKIFALFSYEATFIGFLGSLVGVGLGLLAGFTVGNQLATTMFSSLPGLTLFGFNGTSVAEIVLLVMAIAFLAGTLPAIRAARQDPIESLRYE